ncbi:glutamine synthetase [Salix suchowensis]|nr:glutamine synthetase [Salix suchowensis]
MANVYHNDLLAPYLALPKATRSKLNVRMGAAIDNTVSKKVTDIGQLRIWDFDGSSTNQAQAMTPTSTSTYNNDGTPNRTNYRHHAKKIMDQQEYTLFDVDGSPYGWRKVAFRVSRSLLLRHILIHMHIGTGKVFARDLIEAHYRACLYSGVNISVGPCEGISMGDHLWMARYLLPLQGDWNGAGAHTNYSTKAMREPGGMKHIEAAIEKLSHKHDEHIAVYGEDNDMRLTGRHETGHIGAFSSGVANRGASIRVPRHVAAQGFGYLEDRRPASNIDPYRVTGIVVETTLLG